ncbi:MAG TPA: leucine--tRNA ligase [Candidatus Saccharimonadales bacterium]|nr:leucine--tRNA ligase [Candidatus Saccharimonadales bacterium]
MQRYNPKEIEPKWQAEWQHTKLYAAQDFDTREKYVMLTEFPYPSGAGMHIGHIREYTLGDIMARHKRMQGYNVLYPMGYDAFGLPTENFAIKNKVTPQAATATNVENFRQQLDSMGFSFDWDRSFRTSDPDYYKWTQWLFLQFYKAGLAYQAEIAINWCPFCKTGLANEEVVNGRHERCDTLVEKKTLKQWLLKITAYADRLIEGLKTVDYPSRIADQQINWIGRSRGAEVDFPVEGTSETVRVFTTRPDTIFGATFLVLAPEHPLVETIVADDHKARVLSYVKEAAAKSDVERQETNREKTGVATGAHAINPATGQAIPIWVADYVLYGYGTGAIMAVPAHDERDWEFAQSYNLPIVRVVANNEPDDAHTHAPGTLTHSGSYDGLSSEEAKSRIVADLAAKGSATEKVNYRLRDWIFSRQHYWGEPIPIIHCPDHGAVAVPDDQLPVTLPDVAQYEPTDTGESPLAAISEWVLTTCPECGKPAKRETDTMPNWAGSSWYYLRYFDAHNDAAFADRKKLEYWGAVDMYLGGMEHTTLHLLYSRFWHQFFYEQGLVPTPEPYAARRGQGIILAADGTKMSKSKGNVVDPTEIIASGYGADALRVAIAFIAPYDQTTPWSPEGVAGTYRFLSRVWTLVQEYVASQPGTQESTDIKRVMHKAIQKVSDDVATMSFNTAIAALMECVNELFKLKAVDSYQSREWVWALKTLLQLLAPFAPHMTEELWHQLDEAGSIHTSEWPAYDAQYITSDTMTIVVQINGKVRAQVVLPADTSETEVLHAVQADPKVQEYVADKPIKKSIYVPGKIVSLVV